ncbi:MAG: hypothetical protein KF887_08285 [Paracoccaceae bacterium]|nr:MAG: hypothetical protein KF887_08285 [Paracoccaceae bacterium]
MIHRVLLLALLTAGPAAAGNICRPDPGEPLRLSDVGPGDTLTLREGPAPSYRKIGDLLPGQRDIRATGRAHALTRRCAEACADLQQGFVGGGLVRAIERDCRRAGLIWYEVRTRRGQTGWSSARHLVMAGGAPLPPVVVVPPAPRPPPPDPASFPNSDVPYRFVCGTGEMIRYTQRSEPLGRGEVTVGNGPVFSLTRRKGEGPPIDHAGEGMAIRGDVNAVTWTGLDGRARVCRRG